MCAFQVCACGCIIACEKDKGRGIKGLDLVQEAWRMFKYTSTLKRMAALCLLLYFMWATSLLKQVLKNNFHVTAVDVWTVTFIYK